MKIEIRSSHEWRQIVGDYGYTLLARYEWREWTVRLVEVDATHSDFEILVGTWTSWREALRAGWEAYRFASTGGWRCERCGSTRWVGWRAGPAQSGWPRKAQCVPCGHVQELPDAEACKPARWKETRAHA